MSNKLLVDLWRATPDFANVIQTCEILDTLPEMRTFFGGYHNPIGIEVEAEGIEFRPTRMTFWGDTDDGSLRNNGREFISQPLSGRQIDYALRELSECLSKYPNLSWSHRTSIHIHQNVSTFREKHLLAYTMLYGLYEDLFYSMVKPYRAANAFCYKATSLDPVEYINIQDTNKYCGLNLAPIKRQCTVEFRHMHGTDDFRLVRRWIQLIVKLHAWVDKQSSNAIVDQVLKHIESQSFVDLAKEIWGVNASLFDDKAIQESGMRHALWSLCLSNQEFR